MKLAIRVEIEREDDGRWSTEVMDLQGVPPYGATRDEARQNVEVLAHRMRADRVERGNPTPK